MLIGKFQAGHWRRKMAWAAGPEWTLFHSKRLASSPRLSPTSSCKERSLQSRSSPRPREKPWLILARTLSGLLSSKTPRLQKATRSSSSMSKLWSMESWAPDRCARPKLQTHTHSREKNRASCMLHALLSTASATAKWKMFRKHFRLRICVRW
ncbi:hypothetical protein CLUG_02925 [Clavispora lusitaniae ATCC 42720]|uniref:Uncharacterized protein n=1 Tax=Clavispora lusitaniae (strain ATCC 42720) TaxID=306902 RepID=C4Y312_CLAL4|nr:uncharacterized protein CLUG_02925 [Clavispora lusitaniae ATCC 42720]EEQ38798.1 hypothetical protein CLUG_02925 [Clavispora lusitaniae ATCC 42720]